VAGNVVRTVSWLSSDWNGEETCTLSQITGGWKLSGCASGEEDGRQVTVDYAITTNGEWQTRHAEVTMSTMNPLSHQHCVLERDDQGQWTGQSENCPPLHSIQGLHDIDIQITPASNALPINRLHLEVGEGAEVTAAWIRIPEFTVEPLRQRYTRSDDRTYAYESNDGDFTASLTVDDLGLVVTYDPGWIRVDTKPGQSR
jgi:hypothetical protein